MFNMGLLAAAIRRKPIEFVGANIASATGTGSVSCAVPAGVQEGDLILVAVSCAHVSDVNFSLTTAGFTEILDAATQSSDTFMFANLALYRQIASVSPPGTVALPGVTPDAYTFIAVMVFRNVDQVTPIDVAIVQSGNTGDSIFRCPAITPVTPGAMVVGGGTGASFYNTGTVFTTPGSGGFTSVVSSQRNSAANRVGNLVIVRDSWNGSGAHPQSSLFSNVYGGGTSRCARQFALALRPAA